MCGIHGVINVATGHKAYLKDYVKEGFIVNSVRGMDSAGVCQVDSKNKPFLHKLPAPGPLFIDSKPAKAIFDEVPKSPLTFCHVRAATHGATTLENAHPFMVEGANGKRIIGIHNGSLASWKNKPDNTLYECDSEWGLSRIGKFGIKGFELIDGAFTFVWWDENHPGKLFVARNSGRPFWFVMTKDKTQMLFGSESGMVSWLCERSKIETEDTIYEAEPMKLYTFDYTGKEITFTKEDLPHYKTEPYKYSTPGYTASRSNYPRDRAYENAAARNAANDSWERRRQRRDDATSAFSGEGFDPMGQWEWDGVSDDYTDDGGARFRNDEGRSSKPADSFPSDADRMVDKTKKLFQRARAELYRREAVGTSGSITPTEIVAQRDDDSPSAESVKARAQTNKAKRRAKKAAKKQRRVDGTLSLKPRPAASELSGALQLALRAAVLKKDLVAPTVDDVLTAGNERVEMEGSEFAFPDEILNDDWYTTSGATEAEKEGARQLGMMGQLYWCVGTAYEPEVAEMIGDIEDYVVGTGKKKYVAILRGVSAAHVQRTYMTVGAWCVCAGVAYKREWGGQCIIVGELTEKGRQAMQARSAA